MPRNQSAAARALRARLARRRAGLIAVYVSAIVSLVAAASWFLRPTENRTPATPTGQMLAKLQESNEAPPAPSFVSPNPNLYADAADAKSDIKTSLSRARAEHKRVLLDFGGNWCGDCQILDIYLHQSPNLQLLEQSFLLVHVNVGQYDQNIDIAERYGIPLQKGIPALVVLASDGNELYAQRTGEFESMAHMNPASVTDFLQRWRG